jgi:hypothetical protein
MISKEKMRAVVNDDTIVIRSGAFSDNCKPHMLR